MTAMATLLQPTLWLHPLGPLLKTLHIVSSVLLVGTGLGSAFYLFFARRSGSVAAQAVVGRLVLRVRTGGSPRPPCSCSPPAA